MMVCPYRQMRELKAAQFYQRILFMLQQSHQDKGRLVSGPILGLDVGTRYIGVAVSDADCTIASPHSLIERKTTTFNHVLELEKLVRQLSVPAFVIGYPVKLMGFQGKQGVLVEEIVRELQLSEKFKDQCFVYWDERLTTKAVDNAIGFMKMEHRRRKQILDKMSALCILQGCLDNFAKHRASQGM